MKKKNIKKTVFSLIAGIALMTNFPLKSLAESNDIVMKAMQDEMARSVKTLQLTGHDKPYFVSYRITEFDTERFGASFGAIGESTNYRWRNLKVDVREGNYHLDSSNFNMRPTAGLASIPSHSGGTVTSDDNYDALRKTLWLRTDTAYKTAIKNYEAKKNFLEQNNIQERPDDFSQEAITVSIEKTPKSEDCSKWQSITKSISAIFRDYPVIQRSSATFTNNKVTNWFVNSEGANIRESENQFTLAVMASLQADNGMQLADSRLFCANFLGDFPKEEEIKHTVKDMIESLAALKSAPLAKEYRGPILLEGQASAEFANELLRYNFGHAQETLSSSENSSSTKQNPLKNLVGQSIMPPFLTVIDDPLTDKFHGQTIVGKYKIDEDGIPSQKVVLVDKGILNTFCTSRTPTPYSQKSNGHSFNGLGEASVLYFNSEKQLSAKALKQKLIDLGKKSGLKQVMIARRLATYDSAFYNPASLAAEVRAHTANSSSNAIFVRSPLLLYSVSVDNGHEELVRGALFGSIPLSILRNIICTGNDAKPYFTLAIQPGEMGYYHLVCPSLLIGEIELHQPDKETDKLPILPSPLSEK
jgi:hypothetical protein